jgi:hypothetical protein
MRGVISRIFKAVLFLGLVALLGLMFGCSDEPPRWSNTYIQFYPADMEVLYVRHGRGTFEEQDNGENYLVEYAPSGDGKFWLKVVSYNHEVDHAYFDGFAGKWDEEMDWKYKEGGKVLVVTGKLLEGYDFYEISLSRDKQR